eukprot:CAMPEP_0183703704 /NCGR_PEP_ID=MMETSP0737-20130205/1351_1 /TAXON_ID=385413 /ORGANISM="Thalassiosira miniscula, Strain CCMP1093" /LENGTH=266 /DNA_ID=CAMNT_0025930501 /DNA_START=44 /DNA_END=844 /DNA_ORIENTATION=+
MAATIDAETRRKANLRVLQRIDSNIVDLAITATHVVLYEFNNDKRTWEKKNVEGSLFVTKRSDAPRFKVIVLNRSSTENLEVPITASFQLQVKEPYMIFRDSSATKAGAEEMIRGIWFHDGKERDQIASYLEQVVKSLVKIEEMERNQRGFKSGANEETARQDAGAALLSTLTLGANNGNKNNNQSASTANVAAAPNGPAATPARPAPSVSTHQNLVLDKKSLQLSLLSLIQDERFLDLIHAQYLKVVHTRAARQQQAPQQNNTEK